MKKTLRKKDIILLFERLGLYMESGLLIGVALETCEKGLKPRQAKLIKTIRDQVEKGTCLADSMSSSLRISPSIRGLIKNGEMHGDLSGSIYLALKLMEREDDLKKKMISAMTYPIAIGTFSLLLAIGLVRGIMPQIIPMLKGLNVDLPFLTRFVIFISELLLRYGIYMLLGAVLCSILIAFLQRKYSRVRLVIQKILLAMPIISGLVRRYALALFFHSFGSMVKSGMPVHFSFASTSRSISLIPLRRDLEGGTVLIANGRGIGEIFQERGYPPYLFPLLSAGESSGHLAESAMKAAQLLDREVEHSLKRITALLEPALMAGMGGVVGSIALSIMLPVYDISRVLQNSA